MKIGIISDSHDDVVNVNRAIDIFEQNEIKAVIHAGDIISPPIVTEFKRLTDKGIEIFTNIEQLKTEDMDMETIILLYILHVPINDNN